MGGDGSDDMVEIFESLLEILAEIGEIDWGDWCKTVFVSDMLGTGNVKQGFTGDASGVGDILEMAVDSATIEVEMIGNAFERPTLAV